MKKAQLMRIPLKHFGLPSLRKFPMQDEKHLKAAVAYFHTAKDKYRRELAMNIIKRHRQLNSKIKISKKNPLYKYVPNMMRKLTESDSPLLTVETTSTLYPVIDYESRTIVESLLKRDGLSDVDDLDSQVPDSYKDKQRLLGTLKTIVINEDMEGNEYRDYPLIYRDFPVLSESLQLNNGGIMSSDESIIFNYNGSINEAVSLNPLSESDHIYFSALLREWNELYMNGVRNVVYDRLMIESWKEYAKELIESSSVTPSDETTQKLIDIGLSESCSIKYIEECDMSGKNIEMGFPEGLPKLECDDPSDVFSNSITLKVVVKGDDDDDSYYTNIPRNHIGG